MESINENARRIILHKEDIHISPADGRNQYHHRGQSPEHPTIA